jgi:hypothetical protein
LHSEGRTWIGVFENRVLRRTFRPKKEELMGMEKIT